MTIIDQLTHEERQGLLSGELRPSVVAKNVGVNSASLRGAMSRYRRSLEEQPSSPPSHHTTTPSVQSTIPSQAGSWTRTTSVNLPPNIDVTTAPLTLDWTTFAYGCDLHAPLHNRRMIEYMVRVSRELNVTRLVIGGDLADFSSLSRKHPADLPVVSYEQTMETLGGVLAYLLDHYEQVAVCQGNHDLRLSRSAGEHMSFERVLNAALNGRKTRGKLLVSSHDYLYLQSGQIVAGHPRGYSRTSAALSKVSTITGRNVLGSHTHLCNFQVADNGNRWVLTPGHLCEPEKTPYVVQSTGMSSFPAQKAGFAVVIDGKPQMFNDLITDWSMYGIH